MSFAPFQAVLSQIKQAGGDPSMLVAVSKTYGADEIRPVLEDGQRIFGENRVKEAIEKWPALKQDYPDIKLHLIGPLQTNKAREAVSFFDVIETLDRPRLAEALAKEMARQKRRPDCLVEINIGEEPQKAGIAPDEALDFVQWCQKDIGLPIKGLMCIPPLDQDPAPYFSRMASLHKASKLPVLSMGMSGDFPQAIKAGATQIRVGRAIFGERPS